MGTSAFDLLILGNKKTCGFSSLTRSLRTDEESQQIFSDIGIINFQKARCECGSIAMKRNDHTMKSGFRWACMNTTLCGLEFNPLKNTFLENSHLTYIQVSDIVIHWFFQQNSMLTMIDCKISEHTFVDWMSLCRQVCCVANYKRRKKIGGPGMWVEIDETHLFKRKYNRGHRIKGESVWLFGGVCRETKERFAIRVPNRKRSTLWRALEKNVAKGTVLVTDGFSVYTGVDSALEFAAHEVVIHKENFVNPVFPEIFTNGIESFWSKLKKRVHNSGSNENVDLYIGEFLYRNNLNIKFGWKYNFGQKLHQFLRDLVRVYPGPNRQGWSIP